MPTYEIVVRATITKTYIITHESRDTAICEAHGLFNTKSELDVPEKYDEETVSVTKIEE